MTSLNLANKAETYLNQLCVEIPTRQVGSQGNQAATALFASALKSFGFEMQTPEFDCMDWITGGARLSVGGEPFEVSASPYSLGCQLNALFIVVSNVDELAAVETAGKILLVRGALAGEPLMPKNFPFYNPDQHKQIINLLETKQPIAIVSAASRNPQMAGAMYPYPLIEDGDFDIPSAYMTEDGGDRLAIHAGEMVSLEILAERLPSKACNVIGRKGESTRRRVVFCAHIDSKFGTPGALDNASGVTVLLLLAELLADYQGKLVIEIVAINGEDYYSNPGEIQYFASNRDKFSEILLNVNLDGVGYLHGDSAYSLYECPDDLAGLIRRTFSAIPQLIEGDQWYQGDHMLFVMNRTPALALTSERVMELMTRVVHTPQDTPEVLDPGKLAGIALALRELSLALE